MSGRRLALRTAEELRREPQQAFSDDVLRRAAEIVERVRRDGVGAVRELGARFDGLGPDAPLLLDAEALSRARDELPERTHALLSRSAERIDRFARTQLDAVRDAELEIDGGWAAQRVVPVDRAGCYAPAGVHPLPSSVLMTAVTARVAGVRDVWVASPAPGPLVLGAAAIAGADGVLAVGGAHAIAALTFGLPGLGARDAIVGPGGAYVTAAKHVVSRWVRIDMLAGPSELLVIADSHADPQLVAADLLAQAEHDPLAKPMLIALSRGLVEEVERELESQLASLATREAAEQALASGWASLAEDVETAIEIAQAVAPEHLALHLRAAQDAARACTNAGAIFVGASAGEVLGDYGAGPNHTLPTGGTARGRGGLSVLDFLRVQTSIGIDRPEQAEVLLRDAEEFAGLEGLPAHAASARLRRRRDATRT